MKTLFFLTCLIGSTCLIGLAGCGIDARGQKGDTGAPGTPGLIGYPGQNGHSAALSQSPANSTICPNGGTLISLGIDLNDDGVLQMTEATQIATVCNGLNGSNGTDGVSPTLSAFTPVSIVSACGGSVNDVNNEIFFKLQSGTLVGSVSDNANGLNTRFGVIAPGTYYSTGHNTCLFTVNADNSISH